MHCLLCYVVVTLCSINMSTAAVFFTSHGQPSKQMRLVWYIYAQRYRDHHDDEFIRRCERVRRQFILTSALCGLVMVSMIALAIWH
ncbi:Universal stress protein B [Klebsiella oxytoca]|nr:Universal stress protein B [Klebsiella oxytoca]